MITFQEVSPLDLTTVLFDYNDATGVNNAAAGSVQTWFGIGGVFNLNAPGANIDTSDRDEEACVAGVMAVGLSSVTG